MEDKEKMRKEGLKSPDRGDGILGCIACGARMSGAITADEVADADLGESDVESERIGGF